MRTIACSPKLESGRTSALTLVLLGCLSSPCWLCMLKTNDRLYVLYVSQKPKLVVGGEKFNTFLKEQCPVVSETYYPTFWCWESRVQTLLRPFVTAKPGVSYRK